MWVRWGRPGRESRGGGQTDMGQVVSHTCIAELSAGKKGAPHSAAPLRGSHGARIWAPWGEG